MNKLLGSVLAFVAGSVFILCIQSASAHSGLVKGNMGSYVTSNTDGTIIYHWTDEHVTKFNSRNGHRTTIKFKNK